MNRKTIPRKYWIAVNILGQQRIFNSETFVKIGDDLDGYRIVSIIPVVEVLE